MGSLLAGIGSPADLKRLRIDQLPQLCDELRAVIISSVDERGGHLGSNLGVVELTVALHRVFDVPRDQLVFDVSHQCYAHKMLTGRAAAFVEPDCHDVASGFFAPSESESDPFQLGHSSTAISLACGLARARDMRGDDHAVIALVGDGSLTSGAAYEGLNNAATLGTGLIIVINDNEYSIAKNVGGLCNHLAALRAGKGVTEDNLFRSLGFDYRYVEQGNDVAALVEALAPTREATRPVVVHVHTVKGKGCAWAEAHPEEAHELRSKCVRDGGPMPEDLVYAQIAGHLTELTRSDPRLMVICPATPGSHGISASLRERLGDRFVDVGIAEGHALSFAGGLARGGARPVVCISSTFLQRAYDQLIEDVALNALPVTVLVYKAGLVDRDATHVGSLDIAFETPIPGLTCLAPDGVAECLDVLDWSVTQAASPVIIRVPRRDRVAGVLSRQAVSAGPAGWQVRCRGSRVAFIVLGRVEDEVLDRALPLLADRGISASVIHPTLYSRLDEKLLRSLEDAHELVVVVEDGMTTGGLGERVAAFYCNRPMRVLVRGGAREFTQRVPLSGQYRRYRIDGHLLADDVLAELGMLCPSRVGASDEPRSTTGDISKTGRSTWQSTSR